MDVIVIKNRLMQSVSYLLGDYLIDCGDYNQIKEAIGEGNIKGIFLTHCHQDHVYGLESIMKQFPSTRIYCSEETFNGLKDEHLSLSYIFPEFAFDFTFDENVVILKEGIHKIDNIIVEVISCVGHSDDCLAYVIKGFIFTGDAHIPFAKVFTKWPTSNKDFALESEKKLLRIAEKRNLKICSGHWQ